MGINLPTFTEEQRSQLKGSVDYFALNHYTSKYVANSKEPFSLEGGHIRVARHRLSYLLSRSDTCNPQTVRALPPPPTHTHPLIC